MALTPATTKKKDPYPSDRPNPKSVPVPFAAPEGAETRKDKTFTNRLSDLSDALEYLNTLGGNAPSDKAIGGGGALELLDPTMVTKAMAIPGLLKKGQKLAQGAKTAAKEAEAALNMSKAARMARAADMGFDTSKPFYHGTSASNIDSFKTNPKGINKFGEGVYVTPSADAASAYLSAKDGQNILDLYIKPTNQLKLGDSSAVDEAIRKIGAEPVELPKKLYRFAADDWNNFNRIVESHRKASGKTFPQAKKEVTKLLEAAGYTGLDASGDLIQTVFNPSNIRSTRAAFDPKKAKSSNILAGTAGAGILGVGLLGSEESMAQPQKGSLTAAELAELAELEKQFGPKLTPTEEAELAALEANMPQEPTSALGTVGKLGGKALGAAATALGYAGGLTRTGLLGAADAFVPGDLITEEDVYAAVKGRAPTTDELLARQGYGEMGSVNVPFLGKFTGRGALGFAGDTLLDPTTYLGIGAGKKAAEALKQTGKTTASLLNPSQVLRQVGGKELYQSGLKSADLVAKKFGKGEKALSETLFKYGVTGGGEAISDKAAELASQLANRQAAILAQASSKGAVVDAAKALAPIQKSAQAIASGRNLLPVKQAATSFKSVLDDLVKTGSQTADTAVTQSVPTGLLSPSGAPLTRTVTTAIPGTSPLSAVEASKIKSQIYNLVGDNAYSSLVNDKAATKLFKTAGKRLKTATERAVSGVDEALGAELKAVNKDLGNILTSRKVLQREAAKDIAKNALTSVDAALLVANPAVAAGKKVGDILKSSAFRTNVGRAAALDPGYADILLRQMGREYNEGDTTP